MLFIMSQIFGILSAVFNVVSMQAKTKRNILIGVLTASMCGSVSFIFLGAYGGAAICAISIVESAINTWYTAKNKKPPIPMIISFFAAAILIGVVTFNNMYDVLPTLASVLFVTSITRYRERDIRILLFLVGCTWVVYGLLTGAYSIVASNLMLMTSIIVAMVRLEHSQKINSSRA